MVEALNNPDFSSQEDKTKLFSGIKTNLDASRELLKKINSPNFKVWIDTIERTSFGEILEPGVG